MSVLVELTYTGVKQSDYDSMMPEVEPQLRSADGFQAHFAARAEGGWRVVEVWASQEAAEAWMEKMIRPAMERAAGAMPAVTFTPLHHLLIGSVTGA
jgi:hypothetical protein